MRRSSSAHASPVPRLQNMPTALHLPGNVEPVPEVPRLRNMPTEEEQRIAILESSLIMDVPPAPRGIHPSLRISASSSECSLIAKEAEMERHLLREEDEKVHAAFETGRLWQQNRRASALPRLNLPGQDLMVPGAIPVEAERVVSVKRIRSRFSLCSTLARFSKLRCGFGWQSNAVLAIAKSAPDQQPEQMTQQKHQLEMSVQPEQPLRDLGAPRELPQEFQGSMRNFFSQVGHLPPVILESEEEGDEPPGVDDIVAALAQKRRPVPLSALPPLVEDPGEGLKVEQESSPADRELEAPIVSANLREPSQSAVALAFPWKLGTQDVCLSNNTPESLRQTAMRDTLSVAPQPLQHPSQVVCCPEQSHPIFPSSAALRCCQTGSVCNPIHTEP